VDGLARQEARVALPGGYLFNRPRARLAGDGEIEIEQGASLPSAWGRRQAQNLQYDENPAQFQGAHHPSRQFAIGRFVEVMEQIRD
jgi:hypothetical protein